MKTVELVISSCRNRSKKQRTPGDDILRLVFLESRNGSTGYHGERSDDESDGEEGYSTLERSFAKGALKKDRPVMESKMSARYNKREQASDWPVVEERKGADPVNEGRKVAHHCRPVSEQNLEGNGRVLDVISFQCNPSQETHDTNDERSEKLRMYCQSWSLDIDSDTRGFDTRG